MCVSEYAKKKRIVTKIVINMRKDIFEKTEIRNEYNQPLK